MHSRAIKAREWRIDLGIAALVREVARMDEDVALGQLDGGIVRVCEADDSGPSERRRSPPLHQSEVRPVR